MPLDSSFDTKIPETRPVAQQHKLDDPGDSGHREGGDEIYQKIVPLCPRPAKLHEKPPVPEEKPHMDETAAKILELEKSDLLRQEGELFDDQKSFIRNLASQCSKTQTGTLVKKHSYSFKPETIEGIRKDGRAEAFAKLYDAVNSTGCTEEGKNHPYLFRDQITSIFKDEGIEDPRVSINQLLFDNYEPTKAKTPFYKRWGEQLTNGAENLWDNMVYVTP